MAIEAGTRLGPYEILAPVGAGGMGEVYRARDTRLSREVAVKVVPAHLSSEAGALARFEQESRAVAALSHPNVMAIHDVGRQGPISYAVMELLEGETLRERLSASALPPRKAIEYAQQIARGLAAAHDRGLVHRDLKPENIFLSRDGLVKILDFGLAVWSEPSARSGSGSAATESGVILGTLGYMSPEQVRGRPVDHRSDLFTLGAIFFEMLTGRRAFIRDTPADTMVAILQDDPGLGQSGRPVPPELAEIVAHSLEKNPEDRFQTARDFAFALQVLERDSAGRSGPAASPSTPDASIAVLPFRNMSADPDTEYFSDGVTEEIINALTAIQPLRVAARTSSFAFRGKDADVRQIGRELGVRCVLEGSVRKAGQRLRITAQLIDVATGYHMWSERYDREMEDVFEVQDDIARTIARKLEPKLVCPTEVVAAPTRDVEAYNLYLQGRYAFNLRQQQTAIEKFEAAIARDPGFAAAHLGLADAYAVWGFYGGIPTWEAFARARGAAEKARQLTPGSPEVHLSLGIIEHYYGWDTARERRELQTAIDGNPRSAEGYFWLSLCLSVNGDEFDAAHEAGRKGVELEPHSANARAALGWAYAGARRFPEAIVEFEKAVALSPESVFPAWSLGHAQLESGKAADAVGTLERAVASTHREQTFQIALLGRALAAVGRGDAAGALLAELRERAGRKYVPPFDLAYLATSLGRTEEALAALELAFEERNALLWYRIHMPAFDPLRSEPRWRAIAERLGRTAPVRTTEATGTSPAGPGAA